MISPRARAESVYVIRLGMIRGRGLYVCSDRGYPSWTKNRAMAMRFQNPSFAWSAARRMRNQCRIVRLLSTG